MPASIKTILLCTLLVPFYAFSSQEYKDVTIKDIIVNMETGIHFRINESMNYNEDCGSTAWFKVEADSKYEKEALSLLLSYEAQGKPVTIYLSGCTDGLPKLKYIY